MTAIALAAAIRGGQRRAVEVVEETLSAIASAQPWINAFTDVTAARARAQALQVDAALAAGRDPGPLAGVPFAAKNLFDIAGLPTRAGSAIRRSAPPAAEDAALIARLRAAGAVLVGATNMDEFAFGFTTENAHDGPARNPHDPERVAGGSSGGSAAAVAARLVPLALGSDTNGSIRVPAGLCGLFGLKPTYGRLSRRGAFLFAASFDHVGPLAHDLRDLALAYDLMQGRDERDPVQQDRPAEPVSTTIDAGIEGLRIAIADEHFAANGHLEAFAAVSRAAKALRATRSITLAGAAQSRASAALITMAEGANLHLPDLKRRAAEYDPLTRDRFLAGALLPASWIQDAQRVRARWRAEMQAAFAEADLILTPCVPYFAPHIGTDTVEVDGALVPARAQLGIYTQPFSAIGLPAMAVPLAQLDPGTGLPLGIQLVAPPWREDLLFRAAGALVRSGTSGSPLPRRL